MVFVTLGDAEHRRNGKPWQDAVLCVCADLNDNRKTHFHCRYNGIVTFFECFLMCSGVPRSRRFLGSSEIPKIYDLDHLCTFQIGHPANPKIRHFDHCWTFQTGHPEIPIFHNFDYFSPFPYVTECNCPGQCSVGPRPGKVGNGVVAMDGLRQSHANTLQRELITAPLCLDL